MTMQVKLLRAIQEREVQRVGGDHAIKVDVRILAATNRDLMHEVELGRFRQDLYYRLNVVTLSLPPLRDRVEDTPLLAMHFLKKFAVKNGKQVKGVTPEAMDRLLKYSWPGNVRELENSVERAVVLLAGEYIREQDLPSAIAQSGGGAVPSGVNLQDMTLDEIERVAILEALEGAGGNKSETARKLALRGRRSTPSSSGTGWFRWGASGAAHHLEAPHLWALGLFLRVRRLPSEVRS